MAKKAFFFFCFSCACCLPQGSKLSMKLKKIILLQVAQIILQKVCCLAYSAPIVIKLPNLVTGF